jgi:hypothetical protein
MNAEINSEDKPMPKGKAHKSAPLFSVAELDLANDCAGYFGTALALKQLNHVYQMKS